MARSVFRIGPFGKQEILHFGRAIEDELVCARSHQHPLLDHAQFNFQDLLQVLRTQRLEHDDLVDAVHELGRELPPCRIYRRTIDFFIER